MTAETYDKGVGEAEDGSFVGSADGKGVGEAEEGSRVSFTDGLGVGETEDGKGVGEPSAEDGS